MNAPKLVKDAQYVGVRELRENLATAVKSKRFLFVTDHGKPVKAMVPYEMLLELIEVLEEFKDKTLLQEVKQGRKEYEQGGWIPANRLKAKFSE